MKNEKDYPRFIEGKRIYMREVRISDVNTNYYKWINSPEINRYLETRYIPRSLENIKKYVEMMDGKADEIFLAICKKEKDEHIGNIKIGPINWIHKFADISLLIGDKKYWGKGYASESISLVTKFSFDVLNLHKLKAGCYEKNVGSKKAFEKAGYLIEGILKNQWKTNGEYQDEILLGIINEK